MSTVSGTAGTSSSDTTSSTTSAQNRNVMIAPKRPKRLRPATICAEPGSTMPSSTSHQARRPMSRGDARSG
ncbi:hypothetical protein [Arenivirga flava]|uniref:hypothetical protein n=1 Tax=Arenivirga flava TaxID=1930060 RepID=UPI0024E0F9A3|nr:hypothetical protein [Arenivirga flava]